MPAPVYVVMGAPRAGKETQAQRLATKLGAAHISSGALLRAESRPDVVAIMNSGGLVPESVFIDIITRAIEAVPPHQSLVLEGVAKKEAEAPWLLDYLAGLGRSIRTVIYLQIDLETLLDRGNDRGRGDDADEIQTERWERFEAETLPSIKFFEDRGLVIKVDGRAGPEAVWLDILHKLNL